MARIATGTAVGLGAGEVFPLDIIVMPAPNSHAAQFKQNASSFNTQAESAGFDSSGCVTAMGNSGYAITKSVAQAISGGSTAFLIDDDTDVRSSEYATDLAAISAANKAATNVGVIWMLTNDANSSGGATKAHIKTYLVMLMDFLKEDFPNIRRFFINPLHRSKSGSASDTQYQLVLEAMLEVIEEDSRAVFGIETYDLELEAAVDGDVHILDSVQEGEQARRMAARIAGVYGKGPTIGTTGPKVANATWERTGSFLTTITHDAGTDLTVTSGCENFFGLDVDGTVHTPSDVSKVSASSIRLNFDGVPFDPTGTLSLKVGYGAMTALDRETPEIVADNAANSAPLRKSVEAPVYSDDIISMGWDFDFWPKFSTRTLSGSDVTQLVDRLANTYTSSAGYYGQMNGESLEAVDATCTYRSPSLGHTTGGVLFASVFEVPASMSNNEFIMSMGDDTAGNSNQYWTWLIASADGTLRTRIGNGSYQIITGDLRGKTVAVVENYVDNTTREFTITDGTNEWTASYDPYNLLGTGSLQRIWLMGMNFTESNRTDTNFIMHRFLTRNGSYDSGSDPLSPSGLASSLHALYS